MRACDPGVVALVFGWDFHQYAIGVALGGGGLIGAAMVLTMGNQSFSNYGMITRTGYGLNGPRLPVDAWARRVSVLLLVGGLCLAIIGIGLIVVSA